MDYIRVYGMLSTRTADRVSALFIFIMADNGLCMVSKPLHRFLNLVQTLVGLLTIHVVTHR